MLLLEVELLSAICGTPLVMADTKLFCHWRLSYCCRTPPVKADTQRFCLWSYSCGTSSSNGRHLVILSLEVECLSAILSLEVELLSEILSLEVELLMWKPPVIASSEAP